MGLRVALPHVRYLLGQSRIEPECHRGFDMGVTGDLSPLTFPPGLFGGGSMPLPRDRDREMCLRPRAGSAEV
ncbi:hypothetical protein SBA1_200014 [Candidatus Sulfotelmatobacter kueseliae]|uniref:Uncharacterized protein n=1 Tax=Candidatus Sulfotelmatobacter kueseliae TaxID=2042962 RepID=A0A2U3KGQ3_9BACT|nr:hypothetical protein SBA1_200014 [Candidatus Sulfotelmatobacter kueseliae]